MQPGNLQQPDTIGFANPRRGLKLSDCQFYHTMDVPGMGTIQGFEGGNWDLRGVIGEMLKHATLDKKRVLEIGPASGLLTFEMERRGAQVVAIEIPPKHKFDIVPWPQVKEAWQAGTEAAWVPITNAWWLAHEKFNSKAQMCYVGAYDLEQANIGTFDVGIMANMLLHNRDPLRIINNVVAKGVSQIVIVEQFHHDLEPCGLPLINFHPNPNVEGGEANWNVWWRFTTTYFINYLKVHGFKSFEINRYFVPWNNIPFEEFTLVARR